ncbi:MAG: DUF4956 domain-containing protein [Clostridia bacterium]|nr:DUF4956 domain-containing protein [Clostridia bacterium]
MNSLLAVSFVDVIRNGILNVPAMENKAVGEVAVVMLWALVMAVLIFITYRIFARNAVYDKGFAVSVGVMAVLTAMIITTITSNLTLSLGMVGALSIVRYRTAVKSSLDLVFMFWSVCVGIMVGAGFYVYALLGSAVVVVLLVLLNLFKPLGSATVISLRMEKRAEAAVKEKLASLRYTVASKTVYDGVTELMVSVRKADDGLVDELAAVEGVTNVMLMRQ